MKSAHTFVLSVALVGSTLVVAGAAAPMRTEGAVGSVAAHRVEAILKRLPLPQDECPSNCEFTPCTGGAHKNAAHAQGNDAGEIHSCATSAGGCEDHACNFLFMLDVRVLEELLPILDAKALMAMDRKYQQVSLNTKRSAVQVVGCGGKVVLSLNMTRQQAEGLSAALDH